MNFCTFDDVKEKIEDKEKLFKYIKSPKTFMVELFPYFIDDKQGNLAKYARGMDYHIVVKEKLEQIILKYKAEFPQNEFVSFCDISPLPEVHIAYKSGAGILGKNHLIFDEKYGGYVFIGIIVTDLELKFDKKPTKVCINCKKCEKACPKNAILENGIDVLKCMSYITQENNIEINQNDLKNSKYIWGCDICLDVCPMNKKIEKTDIDEFKNNLIYSLKLKDVDNLTRKEFKNKYKNRAFTYKGAKPIIRNLNACE